MNKIRFRNHKAVVTYLERQIKKSSRKHDADQRIFKAIRRISHVYGNNLSSENIWKFMRMAKYVAESSHDYDKKYALVLEIMISNHE